MSATTVHPTAVVGPGVELGHGVTVGAFVVLEGPCRIGDGAWIGPHSVLGTAAERGRSVPGVSADGGLEVGTEVVVREHVTIHAGTDGPTLVGRRCLVQSHGYVAHDVVLSDAATVAPGALIGGHSWVGEGANVGMGAALRQRSVIGAHAMVGMHAAVASPVPPCSLVVGVPARLVGANRVGLARLGLDAATIRRWDEALRAGEVVGDHGDEGPLAAAVTDFRARVLRAGGE